MKTDEFVKGYREVELTNGDKVKIRAVRLSDLQEAAQAIMSLLNADDAFKSLNLAKGLESMTGLLPHLLKLPEFLGGLCSYEDEARDEPGKWFANLPIEDEFLILETVVEVSNLVQILPRFFAMVGNLKKAMPAALKPLSAIPSQPSA